MDGFPVPDPMKMPDIPTSRSPLDLQRGFRLRSRGPEFPEAMGGSASLGVREAKQPDSGPPDLASTRTDLLYCLKLGDFRKSHL